MNQRFAHQQPDDRQYIISSSSPHCVLGYYGPYDTPEEAHTYFERISVGDKSAALRVVTNAERERIADMHCNPSSFDL